MRFLNVHVRALTAADLVGPPVPNVTVIPLHSSDEEAWLRAIVDDAAGTRPPDDAGVMLARMGFNKPHALYFVAFVNDELAGGAAMVMHDGIAILFSASTHPHFRERGVQTALLAHRLHVATHAGCNLVMVLTTPGSASERNIQRAGFRIAYTKATMIKELKS
jgi:GNAT superfamily N-acetyltransferase